MHAGYSLIAFEIIVHYALFFMLLSQLTGLMEEHDELSNDYLYYDFVRYSVIIGQLPRVLYLARFVNFHCCTGNGYTVKKRTYFTDEWASTIENVIDAIWMLLFNQVGTALILFFLAKIRNFFFFYYMIGAFLTFWWKKSFV